MKNFIFLFFSLLLFSQVPALAQSREVKGKVLDENGQGLPGAGITIQGTKSGTVSDVDGNFTLQLPEGRTTLLVQSIGYTTKTVTVTADNITIRMSPSAQELQGAVVTALGVRREKREIGYSATTLNSDELNNGNNVSAISAIQGKTAGVNITSSTGGPGGSSRIVIRGEKSFQTNNNALLVVDGVIMNNSSRLLDPLSSLEQVDFGNRGNDINPEDIESITVLKGPAAAALYGSQGAAGAVMITTKSGRAKGKGPNKTQITYNTSYTWHSVLKLPEFQNTYGQGNVFDITHDRRENFSWGEAFDGKTRPWGQEINGQQRVKPYSALSDNVRNFFKTGHTWENNVSLGNSNENSSFYLSLNTLNNKGVIPNTYYDKYSIRFNGSTQFNNKFYASVNLNYLNIASRVEAQGQADGSVYDNVLQTPRDIPITELKDLSNVFNSMSYTDATGVKRYGYYGAYTLNPYWVADNFDNRNYTDRVLGQFTIGFKPNDNWNIYNRFGGDVIADRTFIKQPYLNSQPFDGFYDGLPHSLNGGYYEGTSNSVNFYDDLIAQYNKKLSDKFSVNILAGGNLQSNTNRSNSVEIDPKTNGLVIPEYYNLGNATGPLTAANTTQQTRIVALYGSASLNYNRTLNLELTGRNDWNSTLKPGNWSFFYPSANLSYIFTESLRGSKITDQILNYGKIYVSAASVGNGANAYQNNQPGYTANVIESGFGTVRFPFNSVPGYTLGNALGNEDLRLERTNNYEAGVNLGLLRDRITLNMAYYTSRSIDAIVQVPIAPSSGYTSRVINVGEVQNKGFEIELRATPVNSASGFRWELFGTYTRNRNEVVSLSEGQSQLLLGGFSGMGIYAAVGKPFGAFYAQDIQTTSDGRVIVDSATGLPQLTTGTVYKGTYQPRFIASWGTSLSYKGFRLNVLFNTKQGGVFYSRTKDILDFVGAAQETENRAAQVFPNSVYVGYDGNYVTNTTEYEPYDYYTAVIPAGQHVIDASYVKLQEASLDYTVPQNMLRRLPFGSVSVGLYGTNLAIWTAADNKYVDPEVNSGGASNEQGFDFTSRPSLRNFGVRLRVSF